MNFEHSESDRRTSRGLIDLQDRYPGRIMDGRSKKTLVPSFEEKRREFPQGKRIELNRSFSGGAAKRLFPASYFSLEYLVLLIGLTASLLILPLILPPLPPPPSMLLLLPIGILAILMILAFMPSNALKTM